MAAGSFVFDQFALDPADRRLSRAGAPVELSSRYLDALALLLSEPGKLVTKDRFMDEVWHGIPVTDEALTQCIRTLRRQLGDDAARPRFIETVPKHGYRFIAEVRWSGAGPARAETHRPARIDWPRLLSLGGAAALGGGLAGLIAGLLYGFVVGPQPGMGATSALLVLMVLATVLGLIGGGAVGLGVAAAELAPNRRWQWSALGGGIGGLVVGALAKLLGLDAFHLLFGHAPEHMTGAAEGALLGAAVGFGSWLASQSRSLSRGLVWAGSAGAGAGVLIPSLGGRLLGGSLDSLSQQFPDARFRLDPLAALFGEPTFGPVSAVVTGAIEGLLFALGVAAAIELVRRRAAIAPTAEAP